MSVLAIELPVPNNRLLQYMRELLYNRLWWKNNLSSGVQWSIKLGLILAGIAELGHGLLINAVITASWDAGSFLVNLRIWRKDRDGFTRCTKKNLKVSALMFGKNQGLTFLLSEIIGLPMPVTKLVLIPEGLAMNPIMFWVNDHYTFSKNSDQVTSAVRVKWEIVQAAALSRAFLPK